MNRTIRFEQLEPSESFRDYNGNEWRKIGENHARLLLATDPTVTDITRFAQWEDVYV